ncbi:endo alpha-1,4 polygalactosaminidase [Herbaspirillum lusitanum]|uniref:Endo alpha-1,4 polygalactosaminidase n=1 Tax=Herbaspirillum lusitanum TaxID=213312 RepID=A0ABW9AB98_9BURK
MPAQAADAPAGAPASVAFFYGANPPLADLQAFDVAVVEPEFVKNPAARNRAPGDGAHSLFAYVSLGEVQPVRPYYKQLPPHSLRGDNAAWGSRVIDQTAPGWRDFFLDRIIAPLWQQGWRGFFLDTLDSYQLFARTDAERAAQTAAMVDILREFKRRYPDARLMLNRGFELLPQIAPLTYAVAAESLYRGYDAGRRAYRAVPDEDRAWLLGQMETVRDQYHLPVISIDYVDPQQPGARDLARATADKISSTASFPGWRMVH